MRQLRVELTRGYWSATNVAMVATATTAGWFAAVFGYPLLIPVALAAAVAGILSPSIGSRSTRATEIGTLRQQVLHMHTMKEEYAGRAESASARAQATADLVTSVEENVRAGVVADLHDTVTQTLVAAAFATSDPGVPREKLADMMRIAESELRQVMVKNSPLRGDTTLAARLTTLFSDHEKRHGLHVKLVWNVAPDMVIPHPTAVVIYRFVGEALNNVVKHAGTHDVLVDVTHDDVELVIDVIDAGHGFNPDDVQIGRGLELLEDRCLVVGGAVTLHSEPGAGTTVRLALPL